MSQKNVIAASRNFVCIRLATYESKSEAKILKSIFIGFSGDLENTTFCLLSPDGRRKLVRSGRSPRFAFRGSSQMAAAMNRIAKQYSKQASSKAHALPKMADVRLALNVAACDARPLVIAQATTKEELQKLEQRLAKLAWSNKFIGQFIFASTVNSKDLAPMKGVEKGSNILVIEPGRFGQTGKVLVQLNLSASDELLADKLSQAVSHYKTRVFLSIPNHVNQGRRQRIHWKTLLPITDPGRPGRRKPFRPRKR